MTSDRRRAGLLVAPAVLFLAGFFLGPLLLGVGVSLGHGPGGTPGFGQYTRLLGDSYYWEVARNTLGLAAAVTALTLAIGYPYALILTRAGGVAKTLLLLLVVAPLMVNVVVRTFGWMVVFGRAGLLNALLRGLGLPELDILNSWTAIAIALAHVLLPFMVLSIAATLEGLDPALGEAAATLGADPWRQFRHVLLPLSLHGAITGCLLVFALCMGSFVTPLVMGNNRTMVLAVLVYQQLTVTSDWAFAATLGLVLLALVLAVFWLQARLARRLAA
ncbi:MAG: ABC transporter permease [Alphaproteobacteria bacterium]|nr:ABC transporter permease [Alphaproteobacteria bacterium]